MVRALTKFTRLAVRATSAYGVAMAFRHRSEYDESVPRALHAAREAYDAATAAHEQAIHEARGDWAAALAAAVDAGMSYQEIAEEAGVSHTSISRAIKQFGEH